MPVLPFHQDVSELLSLFAKCAKPAEVLTLLKRCNKRDETLAMRMVMLPREEWFESIDLPVILSGYVQQGHPVLEILELLEMSSAIGANVLHAVCGRNDITEFSNWMSLLLDMLDHAGTHADKIAERIHELLNAEAGYYASEATYKPFAAVNKSLSTYSSFKSAYSEVLVELNKKRFPVVPIPAFFKAPPVSPESISNSVIAAIIWPFTVI